MSTQMYETTSMGPGSRYVHEKRELLLANAREELLSLRFSIIVTAKWERAASEEDDEDRRDELRSELAGLRRQYAGKIDEIAMTFGVHSAMKAKEEVERRVTIPRGTNQSTPRRENFDPSI